MYEGCVCVVCVVRGAKAPCATDDRSLRHPFPACGRAQCVGVPRTTERPRATVGRSRKATPSRVRPTRCVGVLSGLPVYRRLGLCAFPLCTVDAHSHTHLSACPPPTWVDGWLGDHIGG